jgi:hypothetical protein
MFNSLIFLSVCSPEISGEPWALPMKNRDALPDELQCVIKKESNFYCLTL